MYGIVDNDDIKEHKLVPGSVYYIAANGKRQMLRVDAPNVTLLTGNEESLDGNNDPKETEGELAVAEGDEDAYRQWYVATGHIDYGKDLELSGDIVHLVLAEGAEMEFSENFGVDGGSHLKVYGQGGKHEGRLTASHNISVGDLTMYGGHVECTKGTVEATGDVKIYGGQLVADVGGVTAFDNILLGWSRATDYILASRFECYSSEGVIATLPGKAFFGGGYEYNATAGELYYPGGEFIYSYYAIADLIWGANPNGINAGSVLIPGGVTYIDPNGERQMLRLSDTEYVHLLDGSEGLLVGNDENKETLAEGDEDTRQWYVAAGHIDYDMELGLSNGIVHLVLADGAEMLFSDETGVSGSNVHLKVYGQGGEYEGRLTAGNAVSVGDLTMYGGHVEATAGKISADGDVKVYGGQLVAADANKGGVTAGENILLGWTNKADDYILVSSYAVGENGTVTIREGQAFKAADGSLVCANTLAESEVKALAKKKLVPTEAILVFAKEAKNEWMTWCSPQELFVPSQLTAYTITDVDGATVTLSEALTTIPAYTPVLIKREAETDNENNIIPLAKTIYAAVIGTGTAPDTDPIASDEGTGFTFYGNAGDDALDATAIANYVSIYGESDTEQSYILYDGDFIVMDNASQGIAAHRCWLYVSNGNNLARLTIRVGGTTGLGNATRQHDEVERMSGSFYDLLGRKVGDKPTRAGVYVKDGRKIVIK